MGGASIKLFPSAILDGKFAWCTKLPLRGNYRMLTGNDIHTQAIIT